MAVPRKMGTSLVISHVASSSSVACALEFGLREAMIVIQYGVVALVGLALFVV